MILLLKNFILIPEFFFCVSFICLIFYGTILSTTLKKNRIILKPLINVSILILIFSTFLFCNNLNSIGLNSNFFLNSILIDYFSEFSKIIISVFSILCFFLFRFYLPVQKVNTFEYVIIILLAILGIFLLCSANDLLIAYLSIELQSLAFYILSSYKKKSNFSINAGLKYFILGAIASCLFLFSTSLLYGITGSINLEEICSILSNINGLFEFYNFFDFYLKQVTCFNLFGFCYSFNIEFEDLLLELYFCIFEFCVLSNFQSFTILNDLSNYFQNFLIISNSCFYYSNFYYFQSSLTTIYLSIIYIYDKVFFLKTNLYMYLFYLHRHQDFVIIFPLECFNVFKSFFFFILHYYSIFLTNLNTNTVILETLELYLLLLAMFKNLSFLLFFFIDLLFNTFTLNLNFFLEDSLFFYFKFFHFFKTFFIIFCLYILIFSLFFKLAIVPFNLWLPDVYEGSISSTTAFFAIIPKLSIFIFFFRLLDYGLLTSNSLTFQYYIIIVGTFSIFFGSIIAIEERKFKSLIAFSAISNIGFSLIALSSLTLFSYAMVFCYFVIYMLSNLVIWFILLIFISKKPIIYNKFNKELSNFSNFYKSNRLISFFFSFALFSIAGIPPFIGFIAKFDIFLVTFESFNYTISVLSILGSIVSIFYYLRIIKTVFFENNDQNISLYLQINSFLFFIFIGIFLLLFLLFIHPNIIYLIFLKLTYTFLISN